MMKIALNMAKRARSIACTAASILMLWLLIAFAGVSIAVAQELSPDVQWKDPSSVRLEVEFPGNGYHANWQLFRCDCGDLLIRSELNEPGEVVHGDILVVSNRVVLSRGYDAGADELISSDAPALMMQLALRLLERSEPAGPSAINKKRDVEVADDVNLIHLDTGGAVGGFPPPWSVKGTLTPDGPTKRRFDLMFSFNTGGAAGSAEQAGKMRLKGNAEYAPGEFPVANDFDLKDWLLSWRDPDDPAKNVSDSIDTVGALRAVLKNTPSNP